RDASARLRERIGKLCYGTNDQDLAGVVLDLLAKRNLTLATAESCTGGLLGGRITEIPGSSRIFQGGVVAYANAVKEMSLDVPDRLLEEHGAVSEPVVRAMVAGARSRFGVGAAMAVTGV